MLNYPRELIADLRDGVVVPFVGAGLSIPSGLPSWRDLIDEMLDEMQYDDDVATLRRRFRAGSLDPTAVPELYTIFRAKHALLMFIQKQLGRPAEPNEYHRLLYRLGARTVLTTNFDNLIEQVHTSRGQSVNKIWKNDQLAFYNERQAVQVVKIHGTIEDMNSVVFSRTDYESFKRERALIYHFVATLFATKTILFLGTSLNDPHLRDIFEDVRERTGPTMRPHYAVMDRADRATHDVLKHYGIETIELDTDSAGVEKAHVTWLSGLADVVGRPSSAAAGSLPAEGPAESSPHPLTIVVGDRREYPPESPGDFLAVTPSTRDLTWICVLGLPESTLIWNDKVVVATQSDEQVPEIVRSRDLLIIGSPYCNLMARRVNGSALFRFNIDREDLESIDRIETRIRGLKRQEADLIEIRKELDEHDDLVKRLRGHGLVDMIRQQGDVGGFREKDEDFATITPCQHPYTRNRTAILVAGIGLAGTMAAVKALSAPEFFKGRPLGGIIKIVIPNGGWYERLTRGRPEWATPAYGNKDLVDRLDTGSRLVRKSVYSLEDIDRFRHLIDGQYREATLESILRRWTRKRALWAKSGN